MAISLSIKIYKGDQLVATKEYDRDIIKIGRLASAHLCLDDEKVSRIHSVLEVGNDGSLNVIDMGSVEGTWVNGKRVTKGTLKFGDEIRLGNTRLVLEARGGVDVQAPAASPAQVPQEPPAADASETTQAELVPPPQVAPAPAAAGPAAPVGPVAVPMSAAEAPGEPTALMAPAPGDGAGGLSATLPAMPAANSPARAVDASRAVAQAEPAPRPQVRPQPRAAERGAGDLGLEIRYYWGDALLGVSHVDTPRNVLVGTGRTDFPLDPEQLGGKAQFAVARPSGGDFAFCFESDMQGELHRKGQITPLGELKRGAESVSDGSYAQPLKTDEFAWVDLGGVRAEFSYAPTPKRVFVPFHERLDYQFLNVLLLLLFVIGTFVITAVNWAYDTDTIADDLFKSQARFTKLILKTPEQKKNPLLNKMVKELDRQGKAPGEMAERHKGAEGKMGKRDAPERNTRSAPRAIDINAKDLVKSTGLISMFGRGGGGLSTIFGTGGLGGDIKGAIGNMFGATVGDARGFGGLGLKGTGGGGGGTGNTIGIGGIGTKGRGGGLGGYGTGVGGLGEKKSVDVGISSTDAVVMGALDKELIRQVIHRHRSEIRYCYEKELIHNPGLVGKVAVKFIITANGSVSTAKVDQSTINNNAVEECVAVRVRSWEFPKPKGGGVVVVTYPFVFKSSGE